MVIATSGSAPTQAKTNAAPAAAGGGRAASTRNGGVGAKGAAPLDEGFLKTPQGKGFAFVGPELRNSLYFGEGAGIAVAKGNDELAQRFNRAIASVRANGTYAQVQDKYFSYDIYGD